MENNKPVFYDIVKTCKGGLVLNLPAYDSTSIPKRIDFKYNVSKIRVPRVYAIGIYIDSSTQRMYEKGYFTVEPKEAFEADVASVFAPISQKPIVSEETIKKALLDGNRKQISEWIKDDLLLNQVVIIARENLDNITNSMIKDLEKMLKIELTIEESNEE